MNKSTESHILCIEKHTGWSKKLIDYLEDSGFSLLTVISIEESVKILSEKKIALILTDFGVPLLEIINQLSYEIPVIIICEQESDCDPLAAFRLGAWDYRLIPQMEWASLERSICKALEHTRLLEENRMYRQALESTNDLLKQNLRTLEQDHEAGKQVQLQLLPAKQFFFESYNFEYDILPSLYLSGDFIDYFTIDADRFGFYIADVSGHGASSAFVTVLLKGLMNQMDASILGAPHQVLKKISDELLKAKLGKYLTMIYCVLDIKKNTLSYSIGGHYPLPILYDGQARYLAGEGFAVGIFEHANYQQYELSLPEKFSLFMFSDGILEIIEAKDLTQSESILLDSACFGLNPEAFFTAFTKQNTINHRPDDIAFLALHKK